MTIETTVPTKHTKLLAWVEEVAELTQPAAIHWCDGSAEEYDALCSELVEAGTFEKLSEAKRPNSYLARSRSGRRRARRGPHVHLLASPRPTRARRTTGATRARCATVLRRQVRGRDARPHDVRRAVQHGPARARRSPRSASSSPTRAYVAVSMRIMTRMGKGALDVLGDDGDFVPCLHTTGSPLEDGREVAARGRATRRSTSSTSPRRARSGPTARATAATRCWARSASRCGSRR